MKILTLAWLIATTLLVGCSTQPSTMYHWGSYEGLLYTMYHKPGEATPTVQIEQLTRDIQEAQENGGRIPPGLYAHLGFMYILEGNVGKATDAFNQEKALFPESAVLIDGLMARAKNLNKPQRGIDPSIGKDKKKGKSL